MAFDLNCSPSTDKENYPFDLNIPPVSSDDYVFQIEDVRDDTESVHPNEETPITVISSSQGTLLIDLNPNLTAGSDAQHVEIDLNQLYEEDEDHSAGNPEQNHHQSTNGKKKNVTNAQRWAIYYALLERSVKGKIDGTTTKEVSELFSIHRRTVQRIWERAKKTPLGASVDVSERKTKNCGRKRVEIDLQRIADIPLHRRTTLRSLVEALGVSYVTLYRRLKEGLLRRHSNALKPYLKEETKRARLQFCLSMIDPHSLIHEPKFVNMYNIVHIDEKWFYMTKKSENYYLLPAEDEPLRTCQSKNFIGKVMFLVAMARPRFDVAGIEVFSGKIGVFPFVTMQPTKRRSRNREAGVMEIKPITSVKREHIKMCLIEEVIPSIHGKWPAEDLGKPIFIQQDNARTHVNPSDKEFQEAASKNGFDIRLICQPPSSPDLNVLDLGFFSAIQALQHKVCPKTVEELIAAVRKAFEEYSTTKINHIFLSLQLCMQETMRVGGSNNYKIPHMKKQALERAGLLPKQITCDPSIVESVRNQLQT
ncbi:PREDICTED: uncharacterized protein LOC104751737 [Camelina sativa]|uniref:Uncharacterized protein LOC104751737 n=1 Tax=Camelina sativa TaxID=90675 RepID=A0ABM0WJQ0_CAMSA|nr:PREDICTED: uncharacterized protein LOC104751737 [Camelina sativa]